MSDEPVNLGAARVDRTGDCRDWSVLDCLRDTIREIESGDLEAEMIYIAMASPVRDDQTRRYRYKAAGGDKLMMRGLLATCLMRQDL